MQILSYSPSIQAVASIRKNAKIELIDLSSDVVQCTVTRKTDAASTFSIRLQNVHNKYNGLFLPFDEIFIGCTKGNFYRLIVGYITTAPSFTLYGSDVTIEGSCPLYRLQQLYWDPLLTESQELMGKNATETSWDSVLMNLLTKVGGYDESQVFIGGMPDDIVAFAYEMYQANLDSRNQLKAMVNDFYEVLQTHGPTASSGTSSSSTASTSGGIDDTGSELGPGGTGTIKIPSGLGNYATREFDLRQDKVPSDYVTSPYGFPNGTNQRRVQDAWVDAGAKHDSKGFCKLDGKYLIATTPKFGDVGTWATFYFSNDTSIETIKIDGKSLGDPGANEWGHTDGNCILEFCGEDRIGDNPYTTLGLPSGTTVTSATLHGIKY